MNFFENMKCQLCYNPPSDFIMLSCSHIICGQCLASHYDCSQAILSVSCPCGITSNILKNKEERESPITYFNNNHSMLNLKKDRSQILDKSSFAIYNHTTAEISAKHSKITNNFQNELRKCSNNKNTKNYLLNELGNEIKFMELRYKRHINEISRHFSKLIMELNHKYQQIQKDLLSKCTKMIEVSQIKSLAEIQNQIQRVFKPNLQKRLIKINKKLTSYILFMKPQQQSNKPNQQNDNPNCRKCSNERKSSSKEKKCSTHEECKKEFLYPLPKNLKRINEKDSKIRKRGLKKCTSNYTISHNV